MRLGLEKESENCFLEFSLPRKSLERTFRRKACQSQPATCWPARFCCSHCLVTLPALVATCKHLFHSFNSSLSLLPPFCYFFLFPSFFLSSLPPSLVSLSLLPCITSRKLGKTKQTTKQADDLNIQLFARL